MNFMLEWVLYPQVIGTVITYELVMLDAVNDRGPPDQEACNGSIYSNLTRSVK